MTPRLQLGLLLSLTVAVAPACRPAPAERRPNVLLIVVDTLRQDHLSCYGWHRPTSPAVDALAADGVRFERAYATAPWTMPSVASIITGLYPSSHGVRQVTHKLPTSVTTLAELLGEQGYATGAVVSHVLLTKSYDYHQGYERYLQVLGVDPHETVSTPEVTRQAQGLLAEFDRGSQPFFLFVHYFDPHYSYKRHPEYGFAAPGAGRLTGSESIERLDELSADMTAEEIGFVQDVYDEEIRFTDEGIGALLATLRELGMDDETLVVFTADHGEEFLTHGTIGHTSTLYDDVMLVPLIVREPGGYRGPSPVVLTPVSLVSLAPTLLDLVGLGHLADAMQADSLRPLLEGHAPALPEAVFAEVDYTVQKRAVTGERFKLIRDTAASKDELYDVAADPQELNDLAQQLPEQVDELARVLESCAERATSRPHVAEETTPPEETIRALKSLGYIGG